MIAQTHAAPAAAELTTITLMGESLPETAIPAAATRLSILGVNENGGTTYVQELEYTDMISMTLSGSLVSGSDSNPTWVRTGEQVGEPYETTITRELQHLLKAIFVLTTAHQSRDFCPRRHPLGC
ncbi:hypothetical protein BDV98DRAFT_299980 [Pterulicium gracile]|uniref:Uncharacterized protein n=1 Tax=Pterulicium gracile TaxID=1884261 RepID=A0A5C3QER7_9AGAR|nr:hypothetical protein BDV98DRAFT_299980 [Pterula gracilis]